MKAKTEEVVHLLYEKLYGVLTSQIFDVDLVKENLLDCFDIEELPHTKVKVSFDGPICSRIDKEEFTEPIGFDSGYCYAVSPETASAFNSASIKHVLITMTDKIFNQSIISFVSHKFHLDKTREILSSRCYKDIPKIIEKLKNLGYEKFHVKFHEYCIDKDTLSITLKIYMIRGLIQVKAVK